MSERTLLLVGCGKMGGALLSRWRKLSPAQIKNFWVIEPQGKPITGMKAAWIADLKFLPKNVKPDVVVFAVKPQQLAAMMPAYRTRFKDKPLFISIAAGKPLAFFTTHFGATARVVRAMPNMPALVGKSMTALCASASVLPVAKKMATELLESVGEVAWVEESHMDAVTAISGSGPAYMFLFLDALTKAGIAAGLSAETARALAVQTMLGSGELAHHSKETFEDLRISVTSPGGTTEAALSVLMQGDQFEKLISEAVQKAIERSKELSR